MSETFKIRDFIVDFLRKELVGPSPGYPAVQINGEEILRPQDPPRQRYGAGILFPMRFQTLKQDETTEGEDDSGDADSPEPDAIVEHPGTDVGEDSEVGPPENPPETDQEVTLANEFLPSAMGISALVEVPRQLHIDVSAGIYAHEEFQWETRRDKDGKEFYPKAWWRRPVVRSLQISASQLLGESTVIFEQPVLEENGKTVLAVHIVSRPFQSAPGAQKTRLITFTLVNRRSTDAKTPDNSDCFFQCGFAVQDSEGRPCFLAYPERPRDAEDAEELSLQLLYQHRRTFAVGHGCAPEWNEPDGGRTTLVRTEVLPTYEVKPVLPTQIQGLDLRMLELASRESDVAIALCTRLADEYAEWIKAREEEIDSRSDLSLELKETGRRHLANCRECLRRIRDGIGLLGRDSEVASAFRLMNEVMLMQQIHYTISSQKTRSWTNTSEGMKLEAPFNRPSYEDLERKWRPFQLAFILMNLKPMSDPDCLERSIVDVIWFPTGGGKTEAYLGLSAFSMFLRRLRNPSHAGTCILMRYTLRLLTTQQFQRAASLICASEMIRRREPERLGSERFSIGLWVGGEVTPNTEENAVKALRQLQSGRGANKFIMLSCPWCGAAMGPQQVGRGIRCKGYRKLAHPARVRLICEDPDCDFAMDEGLPLAVIDEQIYGTPPTLVIGTVDKFAMLAFQPAARRLFGIDTPYPPPVLIIQDELHLISGPLGSMVGHYETVVDALCVEEQDGRRNPAKIIASTATISRAETQVSALYGRSAFLFPSQALKAGDSFFAEERENEIGRLYVGVFATALPSHVTAQVRTMGALLQAPKLSGGQDADSVDPYWTMMGYFNSLRELGHAATLIRADIREFLNAMWDRLGMRLDMLRAATDTRRFINKDVELTSRVQSSEIPGILQQLFVPYDGSAPSEVIDVCFATNMIQVGLDVPRLSLMTVVGQPKTTSEYIQASSRVGRDIRRPGLVVTNYNPFKPRDRSHYEHFRSYHQSIYQYVEPTSVTPFAIPVRERALHALIVILCRFWGDADLRARPNRPPDARLVRRIKETIRDRVMSADPDEWSGTETLIDDILRKWSSAPPPRYGNFGAPSEEMPLMYPAGGQRHPLWYDWPFPTPSSMRNVDCDCAARPLAGGYGDTAIA
jgi:hypothetical protein